MAYDETLKTTLTSKFMNNNIDKTLAQASPETLTEQLNLFRQHLAELPASASELDKNRIILDIAETELALEHKDEAWKLAREALKLFLRLDAWQEAVEACNVLYQADQPASISALAQGVWLAVSFPVLADTTVAMLTHIVDETPDDSDGAAVAAMTACYITDLRSEDEKHESLSFLARNLLGQVAKRHSQINSQEQLDIWIEKMELRDPQVFLPRLSMIINIMAGEDWWFEREELRQKMPNA
ncbi:MAG: hypothetical protein GXP11_03995 [Gammaproteobacteria bacterium]|nr:hypothetical protein [Gammaproteobacteria bacterium]